MDRLLVRRVADLVRHWARETPRAIALRDASHALDFAQLAQAIEEVGESLAARGVQACDRVLIVSENNVASVVWCLAAQSIGAWPAVVNARAGQAEIAGMCARTGPRLRVYPLEHAPAVQALIAAAGRPLAPSSHETLVDPAWGRVVLEHGASVRDDSVADAPPPAEAVGLLIFTSGTTASPKAVMWSHRALIGLGSVLAESRQTRSGAMVTAAGPLSHVMGVSNLMAALFAGATLQLMPRLEVAELIRGIARGEVTHLSLVPTAYAKICEQLEASGSSLVGSPLHYISTGGAPLDPALKERVERLFGLSLVNGYGMTERAPGSRTRPDRQVLANCIGWPERGTEMKIVGGHADAPGELWMRSPTMMMGYYDSPAETAAALREDGWLATGDLARALPDGSYLLVGRAKELIIRSGFNVYPADLEATINGLPGVLQSAVVGRPAQAGNEEIVAFVQLRRDATATPSELLDALRDRIAPYKRPSRLVIVDALPLGPTGKVLKSQLGALARELA